MNIKIYQINPDRDKKRIKYEDLDNLKKYQGDIKIDASIYDRVFMGDVDCEGLEPVFEQFNLEGHPLHRGGKMSVSDIVVTDDGAYYCDSIGFKKVDFDESLAHAPDNLLSVVYVEPNRKPFVSEIEHTLEAEQKAVGGLIELVYNDDETAIVCNEESKLMGLEGNRRIGDGFSVIAGPFFIIGLTEDDFRSLTEDEISKYMIKFAEPEEIPREDVEADMGVTMFFY